MLKRSLSTAHRWKQGDLVAIGQRAIGIDEPAVTGDSHRGTMRDKRRELPFQESLNITDAGALRQPETPLGRLKDLAQACEGKQPNLHTLSLRREYVRPVPELRLMRTSTLTGALALSIALAAASAVWANAAQCTVEVLTVQGTPLTVSYCITAAPHSTGTQEIIVPMVATYSAPGRSLRVTNELHFLAGEGVSRVLESLDLSKLGLSGTLHLTLAYVQGLVHVEGALLTPGAITIK
jgi:hypothetical protein